MAIEKRQVVYEQLCRFNSDGTVRGQHVIYLDQYVETDSGEVLFEKEGHALPVGDAASGVPLESALGQIGAALARAEEIERGRREAAESARRQAESDLSAERVARERAEVERDETRAELGRVRAQRDARPGPL